MIFRKFILLALLLLLGAGVAMADKKQGGDALATSATEPEAGTQWTEQKTGMEFVWVPSGCFQMGSGDGKKDELPIHKVCVPGFWMGKYEVTQAQYQAVMGSNPSHIKGDSRPVEKVSWLDALDFIGKLNSRAGGNNYHLPTEAEWEYACRAGTKTRFSFGDDEGQLGQYAWFSDNAGSQTHPVGQKLPNDFGLYDMHGNVWEWTASKYTDEYNGSELVDSSSDRNKNVRRVLRGGSWIFEPAVLRSAIRLWGLPSFQYSFLGFRLAKIN